MMQEIRKDFPFLDRRLNGNPMVYLDNAATTQKPRVVIDRIVDTYTAGIANVHRAVNALADEVTRAFEGARETVGRFIGAQSREIIFVNNATHGINLVCQALGKSGSIKVLTTTLEHHSNLLPWLNQGRIDFIHWGPDGQIDLAELERKLLQDIGLVAIAGASNLLGSLHPIRDIVERCHAHGAKVLIDAAQSIPHEQHDVSELGCDFLVFSAHKIYGPSGVGALYVSNHVIDSLEPVLFGGSMIKEAHADSFVLNDIPHCFEAGTPNIEGVIGFAAALEYFSDIGYDNIRSHERELVNYAKQRLIEIPGVRCFGPATGEICVPLVAFQLNGLEPTAIAKILGNRANVIVRSGFHCAQAAHDELGIGPTVRASFGVYNTKAEIDVMIETLTSMTRFLA